MDKQLQEYDANVGFRCRGITVNIDDMVRSIDFDPAAHDRPRVFLALKSTFMFASFMTFPGQCNSRFAAAQESAIGTKRTSQCSQPMSAFGGKAGMAISERDDSARMFPNLISAPTFIKRCAALRRFIEGEGTLENL